MKKWIWPIAFVLIVWWLFVRRRESEPAFSGAQDPITNLSSNLLSSLKAKDQVLKIAENIPAPKVDTSDSLVDDDMITQNVVRESEFLNSVRSNEEKILLKKDRPDPVEVDKSIPHQRDQIWWPKRMYIEMPEWLKNAAPCECGCGELTYKP